jgi:hypothetical protein
MKKLLLAIIGTLLISGGAMSLQLAYTANTHTHYGTPEEVSSLQLAYAADDDTGDDTAGDDTAGDDTAPTKPLYDATFDVQNVLKLEGQKQDATYFTKGQAFEENRSPIVKLIVYVIEFVTKIIGSVAMILVIIGGFVLMVSQGNQQTLDKGKEIIKYAFFGLMITFASYTIGVFIQSVFYQ